MKKTLKEAIFVYLAIAKAIYWFNTIITIQESDLEGAGQAVLQRLLQQDFLIIIGIIIFFSLEKLIDLKKKNAKYGKIMELSLFYGIGYVVFFAATVTYIWAVLRLMGESFELPWLLFLAQYTVGFIALAVFLELKFYLKDKEKKTLAPARSTQDQLAMLEALREDGLLTWGEYERKKEKLAALTKTRDSSIL